jgi:hypothetical protein
MVTFGVPTPSTPHSILSPGDSAATPGGVPCHDDVAGALVKVRANCDALTLAAG